MLFRCSVLALLFFIAGCDKLAKKSGASATKTKANELIVKLESLARGADSAQLPEAAARIRRIVDDVATLGLEQMEGRSAILSTYCTTEVSGDKTFHILYVNYIGFPGFLLSHFDVVDSDGQRVVSSEQIVRIREGEWVSGATMGVVQALVLPATQEEIDQITALEVVKPFPTVPYFNSTGDHSVRLVDTHGNFSVAVELIIRPIGE